MSGTTSSPTFSPGIASNYIKHFPDLVQAQPIKGVVLYARVSGREQRRNQHLDAQMENLRYWMAVYGVPVLRKFGEAVSGWKHDARPALSAAIAYAGQRRTVVVAETTCRYSRHVDYDTTRQTWPTVEDFEDLARRTGSVVLATVLHPDTPFDGVQRFQQKRWRADVPEPVKWRKVYWMAVVGLGARRIAKIVDVPESTVRRWVRQYGLRSNQ